MSADRRSCAATLHSRPGANRRPTESLRGEPVADSGPRCNRRRRSDDDPATIILDLNTATAAVVEADARAHATNPVSPEDLLRVRVDEPTTGVLVLRPIGEIDLYTVALLRDVVAAALQTTPHLVVIDLAGVGFLGAKGVRAVVEAKARASSLDIPLRLAGGNAFTRRLLRICGDDAALDHFPTVEEALAEQDPR